MTSYYFSGGHLAMIAIAVASGFIAGSVTGVNFLQLFYSELHAPYI